MSLCLSLGFAILLAIGTSGPAGCRPGGGSAARVPGPLASSLLALASDEGIPAEEVARAWSEIVGISNQVSRLMSSGAPYTGADAISQILFARLGFTREIHRTGNELLLLPAVVQGRRGGCVGLSALVLTIGETLDLPLAGILVPGHFFVRELGPGHLGRNVELLRQGEAMPDTWYRQKYGPWALPASAYMRPLSISEVGGVHWFNIGNQRRATGDLAGATEAYRRALQDFPTFAEAAASLGALEQLQGDLQGARLSYDMAARARPDLPGLAHNLDVLEAERNAAGPVSPVGHGLPVLAPDPEHHSGEAPRRPLP